MLWLLLLCKKFSSLKLMDSVGQELGPDSVGNSLFCSMRSQSLVRKTFKTDGWEVELSEDSLYFAGRIKARVTWRFGLPTRCLWGVGRGHRMRPGLPHNMAPSGRTSHVAAQDSEAKLTREKPRHLLWPSLEVHSIIAAIVCWLEHSQPTQILGEGTQTRIWMRGVSKNLGTGF